MKRLAFSIVFVGTCAVAGLFVSSGLAEPTTTARRPDAEQLTALKTERRRLLREAVKSVVRLLGESLTDYGSVSRVSEAWLNAGFGHDPSRPIITVAPAFGIKTGGHDLICGTLAASNLRRCFG